MSVGNLKTQGDKGNNWTWQNAVLQLLGQIAAGGGGGCPCPSSAQELTLVAVLTALTPVTGVTPTILRDTGPGNVAAGARSVSIYNAGLAPGLVLTDIINPGEMVTWDAGGLNNVLAAINYDASGTELVITTVV